ncbi:MAG: WecB/TagA/CpsF family glycosyltransferase [Nitrospirales bacterium]|nr:WecB/TagA/CpsF family glycosyltransferase [Nitrospira sp.]MDR4502046.1 WecB/TagA/CpsF family glycosyltransferase [Nitrospirales bacterium]
MRQVSSFLGVLIDRASLKDCVNKSLGAISGIERPVVFACANPHSLTTAQSDTSFRDALNEADIVVPDGVGISLLAKVCGISLGPRITGADYFFGILNALSQLGSGKIYFFGSSSTVLELIAQRFKEDFPSLKICGLQSPPFGMWGDEDNAHMIEAINEAKPDVLWVGMTAPKQEKWVSANRHKLNVPVIGSIGAVFDFYARTFPRAPQWMCKAGLEWLYRLLREPRRMWKRNFLSTPHFVALSIYRHLLKIQESSRSSN